MGWEAASYLMATSAPASFHGPVAYTPDGPEYGPESNEETEYALYLMDWHRRVDAGEFDDMVIETLEESCLTNW